MDEAWQVIQWMSADYYYIDHETGDTYFGVQRSEYDTVCKAGQAVKAENGFIPNQAGLFESTGAGSSSFIKEGEENLNLHLFAYAIEYESAGDWWYLPNGSATWIQQWAGSLNSASGVRGGSLRISDWFSGVINGTNQVLHSTFNYYGDESGEAVNVKNLWNNNFGA